MQEFRDAARREAAFQAGAHQVAFVELMGALTNVLNSIHRDVTELKVHVGTLREDLTAFVGQELAERIDPLADALDALEARVAGLEGEVGDVAREAGS